MGQPEPKRPIEDRWTSFAEFQQSGLMERFAQEGYRHTWAIANRVQDFLDRGWEVFVETLDGTSVQYKIEHQPAVGGYLLLLRRPA